MTDAQKKISPQLINEALEAIQMLFRQVRPLILERAGKVTHTDKHDGSPVTDTDIEVENIIKAELNRRFPGMPIFGEEAGYGGKMPHAFWLLDPIDGTKSFIENIPTFTSMAVLIQGGDAIASVIYNISTDDMYVARKGEGAYKNGIRLDLQTVPLSPKAYCKARFFDALNDILVSKGVTCENGPQGGGYGFTMVADGKSAARFNLLGGGYTHDYAPGALLVREAGGVILPVQDHLYTYESKSFVAAHPALESVLSPHLQALRVLEATLRD